MEKLFVELEMFTRWLVKFMTDDEFAALEALLRKHPDAGAVIPGTGGIRKLRVGDRAKGKGKRGGARVLYLHVPEANWIYFLAGYEKNEKDDLSPLELKRLGQIAAECREEALKGGR